MVVQTTTARGARALQGATTARAAGEVRERKAPAAGGPGDAALAAIDRALDVFAHAEARTRAHDRLARRAGVDLDRSGAFVLRQLSNHDGIRLGELAQLIGVDAPTITRKVAQLQARGFVRRQPDPVDGRAQRLQCTPAGHAVLGRILAARRATVAEALAGWTPTERRQFATLLERFVAVTADPAGTDRP